MLVISKREGLVFPWPLTLCKINCKCSALPIKRYSQHANAHNDVRSRTELSVMVQHLLWFHGILNAQTSSVEPAGTLNHPNSTMLSNICSLFLPKWNSPEKKKKNHTLKLTGDNQALQSMLKSVQFLTGGCAWCSWFECLRFMLISKNYREFPKWHLQSLYSMDLPGTWLEADCTTVNTCICLPP